MYNDNINYYNYFYYTGQLLVIAQGPLITIYDVPTAQHIKYMHVKSYNIHHSFVMTSK